MGAGERTTYKSFRIIFCSATVYGRHVLDLKKMDKIRLRQLLTIVTIVSTAIQQEEKAQLIELSPSPKGKPQN